MSDLEKAGEALGDAELALADIERRIEDAKGLHAEKQRAYLALKEAQEAHRLAVLEAAAPWKKIREGDDWGVKYLEWEQPDGATSSASRAIRPRVPEFQYRITPDGETFTAAWVVAGQTHLVSDHGHEYSVTSNVIRMLIGSEGMVGLGSPDKLWVLPEEWERVSGE